METNTVVLRSHGNLYRGASMHQLHAAAAQLRTRGAPFCTRDATSTTATAHSSNTNRAQP